MGIEITLPDRIIARLNTSFTIECEEGTPSGGISLGGTQVPHRLVPLTAGKYKVTVFLDEDARGKTIAFSFRSGASEAKIEKKVE